MKSQSQPKHSCPSPFSFPPAPVLPCLPPRTGPPPDVPNCGFDGSFCDAEATQVMDGER